MILASIIFSPNCAHFDLRLKISVALAGLDGWLAVAGAGESWHPKSDTNAGKSKATFSFIASPRTGD